jgi:hypothetical protein
MAGTAGPHRRHILRGALANLDLANLDLANLDLANLDLANPGQVNSDRPDSLGYSQR